MMMIRLRSFAVKNDVLFLSYPRDISV